MKIVGLLPPSVSSVLTVFLLAVVTSLSGHAASGASDSDVGHFTFPDGLTNLAGAVQVGKAAHSFFLAHHSVVVLKDTRVASATRSEAGAWSNSAELKVSGSNIKGSRDKFTGSTIFEGKSGTAFTDPFGLLTVIDSEVAAYGLDAAAQPTGTSYGTITGLPSNLLDVAVLNLEGRTTPTIFTLTTDGKLALYDVAQSGSDLAATDRKGNSELQGTGLVSLGVVDVGSTTKNEWHVVVYVGRSAAAVETHLLKVTATGEASDFTVAQDDKYISQLVGIDFARVKSVLGADSSLIYGTAMNPSEEESAGWRTSLADPFQLNYDTTNNMMKHTLGAWVSGDETNPVSASTKLATGECSTSLALGTVATRSQLKFQGESGFEGAEFVIQFHNEQGENLSFTFKKTTGKSGWKDGQYGTVTLDRTSVIGSLAGDKSYTFYPVTEVATDLDFDIIVDRHSVIFTFRGGEAAGVLQIDHKSYFDKLCLSATSGNVNLLPTSVITHLKEQAADAAFATAATLRSLVVALSLVITTFIAFN